MTKVALKGMKFYAFHGFYDFERRVGNNYVLDVEVEVDLSEDPKDQIENTVNYESIYEICQTLMQRQYRLLESVAYDIGSMIKHSSNKVVSVKVTLAKLNPPLDGKVEKSEIVMTL